MGVINLGNLVSKLKNSLSGIFVKKTDKASKNKFGIVKIGNGIDVASGVISVSATNSYSETEHVIGKWIDGTTDVYEKTFAKTDVAYTSGDYEMGEIAGIDKVISLIGSVSSSDKSTYYPTEYTSTTGKISYFYLSKGETNKIYFKSTDTWSSTNLIATVRYIKTTT